MLLLAVAAAATLLPSANAAVALEKFTGTTDNLFFVKVAGTSSVYLIDFDWVTAGQTHLISAFAGVPTTTQIKDFFDAPPLP